MDKIASIFKHIGLLFKMSWEEDKWHLLGYFLTTVFAAVLSIAGNIAYKFMIDAVFSGVQSSASVNFFLVISTYLVTYHVSAFFWSVLSSYYFDYIFRSKLQNILSRKFMEKLADLDFVNLENGEVRNLIAKAQDSYTWRLPEIIQRVNYLVFNSISLILATSIALQFSPFYTFLLLAVTIPFYILRAKAGNAAYSIYSLNAFKTNLIWVLRGMFTNFSTVSEIKLYGLSKYFLKQTKDIQDELLIEYRKPILWYSLISTLEYLATPLVMYFAINGFIAQIIQKQRSIGDFTLFVSMLFTFGGDVANILNNTYSIYDNNLYAADYFKLLSLTNTIQNNPHPNVLSPEKSRTIQFEHVSFSYPQTKKQVLKDISLSMNSAEDIAIVGHNGAGKTTLIKLLLRFYDPTEGRILVDGLDLKEVDIASWYRHIGILFQDFARYDLPLKENIQIGNIEKSNSKDWINEVIEKTDGKDIVHQLTKGLDQRLGRWLEGSEELSTGQWQKVAIARALYRDAPLLILDEPTSNIDAEAEYKIFENLKKVYKTKSLIFISHRFSTVRMADKIFVLEKGKLAEQGSHKELLKNKGLYAKYFSLQKKGYE